MPTKKNIFRTGQKISSQLKYHQPAIFVHRTVWSARKGTHSTSCYPCTRFWRNPHCRKTRIFSWSQRQILFGLDSKSLQDKVSFKLSCIDVVTLWLNICALKDAELHSFLLCTCCFFLIGFLWFYMAGLEGCEDILRLSSTTSVGQGNPITIQSLEEGNFTFNGNKRRNFPSNILCSSSWMIVSLSFASSERLEDRQWCCYSISEFCLVFTAGSHWQLTFSLCSSTTPTCFSEVLLRQLFSIHKKTMACICTRFLILSSQPGIGNSASEVQDVHLSFIKVYATDFRSSLRFKRSCWNQCVKVLVIWPHKLNSMPLAI